MEKKIMKDCSGYTFCIFTLTNKRSVLFQNINQSTIREKNKKKIQNLKRNILHKGIEDIITITRFYFLKKAEK